MKENKKNTTEKRQETLMPTKQNMILKWTINKYYYLRNSENLLNSKWKYKTYPVKRIPWK